MSEHNIGAIIKQYRRRKKITLQELSNSTGLSVSYLSMLERDLTSPTVANLNLICEAFGITMSDLILKLDSTQVLVRKEDRRLIFGNDGYIYEATTEGKHQMSGVVMTISDCLQHVSTPHVADEIGFVVCGQLELTIDEVSYILNPGDCIYINANSPHSYRKIGDEPCITHWVYGSPEAPPYSKVDPSNIV